jgi:pimeloyl-ACP methyl ester carboxylesterase
MSSDASSGAEATGHYALVNGVRLYYEEYGAGRPLILLHGGMLTIDLTFGPMIAELATQHRVIAIELQGHGHSADSERAMSIDNLIDDVVALVRSLEILEADFFGFSLGGIVALGLALYHPHLVGNLVLASTPYQADGYHADTRPESFDPSSSRMPTAADAESWLQAYRRVAPGAEGFAALQAKVSATVRDYEGWSRDEMRSLQARTLILVGDNDFVRLEHAEEMAQLIGHGQLTVIPHATHTELLRRPEEILATVVPFLAAS